MHGVSCFTYWKYKDILMKNMSFLKVIHGELRLQFRGGQSLRSPIRPRFFCWKHHILKKNMSFLKLIRSELRLQFRGGQSLRSPIRPDIFWWKSCFYEKNKVFAKVSFRDIHRMGELKDGPPLRAGKLQT